MIGPVQAGFQAGNYRAMVTDGGVHTISDWANITIKMICEPAPDASENVLKEISSFKMLAFKILVYAFNEAKSYKSPLALKAVAHDAAQRIADLSEMTRWRHLFDNPDMRQQIEDLISRNILTMREIALKTE
jgi:hypothetical protein